MVFTEQDYFNFYNDPTSLFNYTFLYLLREATCLFVGLSMQDENIRRMLHLSKMERVQDLIREGVKHKKARERSFRHFVILKRCEMHLIDKALQQSLLRLGTHVLDKRLWGNSLETPTAVRVHWPQLGSC